LKGDKIIEAVIFDWAGTTVDYGCFAPVQAFIETFKNEGIEVSFDEVRQPMGALKRDHIRALLEMPRITNLFENVPIELLLSKILMPCWQFSLIN